MKLDDYILEKIYEYPSLYLHDSYENSRLAVLEHVFLVLGNGLGWAKTRNPKHGGYVVDEMFSKSKSKFNLAYGKQTFKEGLTYEEMAGYGATSHIEDSLGDSSTSLMSKLPDGLQKLIQGKYLEEVQTGTFLRDTYSSGKHFPYPFAEEYWLFNEIEPSLIQPDWRDGMIEVFTWALGRFKDTAIAKDRYYGWENGCVEKDAEQIGASYKDKPWANTIRDYGFPEYQGKPYDFVAFFRENRKKGVEERIVLLKNAIKTLTSLKSVVN